MYAFFISYYLVLTLMNFLGSAFGVQRCLNGCLSSYGQQLMIGYSLLIIFLRDGSLWLIGVVYAATMGNQWITFFSIVSFLTPYNVKILQCLRSSG